ncbi:right-handed parallel beta-helix repeat-containing protein [Pontibacter sp. G13]|uniref:right-handed parallel beta-helix repeat-containing protein n=1 Tax=Pontibacter sp. G13 TaxID=3074898 RepID=UPI00288BD2C1|nr:right-handed parallel beta-helix repeat-containing protein [Pontibacter sp. G13]WNJ18195.1 right-handed parallel beta-helix repeat-containing protein [Pontibacter sp. G13]
MRIPLLIVLSWMALMTALSSCEQPSNPVNEGLLTFNSDTVHFDTIFTTLQAPTERLIVRNEQGRALAIDRIWMENGGNSEFDMIVDGVRTSDTTDLVISQKDSMHIFITMKSYERDGFAMDYVNFQIGEDIQKVPIMAWIVDAYFLTARVTQGEDFLGLKPGSFFFRQDTTLTPEKPIIFDGPIFIPEGVTVTVEPGTQLHFTPYKFGIEDTSGQQVFGFFSSLFVDGTLVAEGTPSMPIKFQGTRFDTLYQELPAQWRGLFFHPTSRDSKLEHCVIQNAQFGVKVDSSSVNLNPKLIIRNTEIKNMGVYGFFAVNVSENVSPDRPTVLMENSIINTCKDRTVAISGGGSYEFNNCTFANFNLGDIRFSRRTPQIIASNWYTFDGANFFVYPSYVSFNNCVIWGSEDNEIIQDTLIGYPFDELVFDHCIVKLDEDNEPFIRPHLVNCRVNEDPKFWNYFVRDYRPADSTSPVINAGKDIPGIELDFRGLAEFSRTDTLDIGAFEYYLIEEE